MLDDIATVFFIIAKVFAVYFMLISLFGLVPLRRRREADRHMKFAVLVAARNEEKCIAGIVESIQRQNYPPELRHIYVIPNNCTDGTEGAAIWAGARIISVSSAVRGKGAALREATEKLLESPEGYDAFVVFDADNEADENFLYAMNKTLCSGSRVAKSRILSKNREQSWVCACYEIYFCTANLFMNRARERLRLSARLIGTGFAVTADFLREIGGFRTETITEDAEFYAICSSKGERIAFCEEAVTYDEEPLSFKTSLTQRKRWMSGILQVTALKFPQLAVGLIHKKSVFYCLDVLLQFSFGYVQALLPLAFILGLCFSADPMAVVAGIPISILLGYTGAMLNGMLALALQKRLSASMIKGLLMYPVFVFSFIPLQTISLFKRTTEWREIHHTGVRLKPASKPEVLT